MTQAFDVFKESLVNANADQIKDLIQQIERSRENGDITETERDNLKDIANRNLDAIGDSAFGRLNQE